MTNSPWTSANKARALELAEAGMKAEKIAAALGFTKNQVVGWFNRNYPGALLYSGSKSIHTSNGRLQKLHDKMNAILGM